MSLLKGHIVWADDEIEMLEPHIIYLRNKGYMVTPLNSGEDAIEFCDNNKVDILLLDEMMTGMDGLTTLKKIKIKSPLLPVIMITKNEEEWLMEEAIAAHITQYLTKPVNPSQILIACKDVLESKRIKSEFVAKDYLHSFQELSNKINHSNSIEHWYAIMDDLIDWSIDFDEMGDQGLGELLKEQWNEANSRFTQFVMDNYSIWMKSHKRPIMSPDIIEQFLFQHLNNNEKVVLILLDCLRSDQLKAISKQLSGLFHMDMKYYLSILPTATPYSRNAIFSGYFPKELQEKQSILWNKMWKDEKSMNRYEPQLLEDHLNRLGLKNKSIKYHKILNHDDGNKLAQRISEFKDIDVLVLVVNFIDILGHKRVDSKILQEMVPNESAYRKAICSWLQDAWLLDALEKISTWGHKVFITSDHGSILVDKPVRVKGDKTTSTGIRYKYGRNLNLSIKSGMQITETDDFMLPQHGINSEYIIAKGKNYFIYPSEYHRYSKKYENSFQHGGISLEEMIIPFASLVGKEK